MARSDASGWFLARDSSVLEEAGVRQPDVRVRIPVVDRNRVREVRLRLRERRGLERLEQYAPFGESFVCLEAGGFTRGASGRLPSRPERARHLADDPILQVEHRGRPAIGFRVGHDLARLDVHRPGHDSESITGALKAAHDREADAKVGRHPVQIAAMTPRTLDHPDAIDHAEARQRPQIVRHRLGDTGREPVDRCVAADVGEVEHGDRARHLFDVRRRRLWPSLRNGFDSGHEPVAPARDGLDVRRLRRIVVQRLTQLGDRLRERVVGYDHIGPDGSKELLLRHERGRTIEQIAKKVEHLGRRGDWRSLVGEAEGRRVESKRTERVERHP